MTRDHALAAALRAQAEALLRVADVLEHPALSTDELIGARQAAALIHRSRRGLLELVRSGALPATRSGRRVLVRRRDLDEYLERQRVRSAGPRAACPQTTGADVDEQIASMIESGRLRRVK